MMQVNMMKIYTLIEDTKPSGTAYLYEHGLSLYFEHGGKRILFDTGASDRFVYNATLLGLDLVKVDCCVISHAHDDHTGGLPYFLDINRHAKVYIKAAARGDFYSKHTKENTRSGIDPAFFEQYGHRLQFIDDDAEIAQGVYACNINKYRRLPLYTSLMLEKKDGAFIKDALEHELFVAIKTGEGTVVLTGCAHHGVLNMLMTAEEKHGHIIGVAGGFHLGGTTRQKKSVKREPESEIVAIAKFLEERRIKKAYTGHCTGERALEKLSLLARVKRMRAGDILEF